MAYMDKAFVDCSFVPDFVQCNCTATFLHSAPHCMAANPQHAQARMARQVRRDHRQEHRYKFAAKELCLALLADQNAVYYYGSSLKFRP